MTLEMQEVRPWPAPGLLIQALQALDAVPLDKHGAIIGYATEHEAGLAVMARLKKGWSFVGKLDKPWSGKLEANVSLVKVW